MSFFFSLWPVVADSPYYVLKDIISTFLRLERHSDRENISRFKPALRIDLSRPHFTFIFSLPLGDNRITLKGVPTWYAWIHLLRKIGVCRNYYPGNFRSDFQSLSSPVRHDPPAIMKFHICRLLQCNVLLLRYIYIYIYPWLMESGGSMPHLQGLSNNPYPEPNQPDSPHWYLSLQGPF